MNTTIDHDLEDLIIRRVQQGPAVEAPRGPRFDRSLTRSLGLRTRVHQSEICRHVNHLVSAGFLVEVDTGRTVPGCMTDKVKNYPIVRYELA